eukprot:jgi/Tetstr1/462227/TSEL_000626.t1
MAKDNYRHVFVRLINKIASMCGGKSPSTQPIKNKIQGAEEVIENAGRDKAAVQDELWFKEPMFQFLCQRITENKKNNEKNKGKPATKQLLQGGGNTTAASAHSSIVAKVNNKSALQLANPQVS